MKQYIKLVTLLFLATLAACSPLTTPEPAETATIIPTAVPTSAPTSPPASTVTTAPTQTPAFGVGSTMVSDVDGRVMMYVPEGSFLMGSTNDDPFAFDHEFPQHEVYLDAYWIDQTEVSNAMFAAFLNAMGNQQEGGVRWVKTDNPRIRVEEVNGTWQPVDSYADRPVVVVTWYGARAYCEWAGRRLPTEAEWEKAARGTDGRRYPRGDDILTCRVANYRDCMGDTVTAGLLFEGASPYGVLDMAGNVSEWVADWLGEDYYHNSPLENPSGPPTGESRVLRGGSWLDRFEYVRSAHRGGNKPDVAGATIGFRCALDASP